MCVDAIGPPECDTNSVDAVLSRRFAAALPSGIGGVDDRDMQIHSVRFHYLLRSRSVDRVQSETQIPSLGDFSIYIPHKIQVFMH